MKKSALIVAFALLSTLGGQLSAQTSNAKQITLEDIWQDGTFRVQGISSIRSMNDGEHYCTLTRNGIEKYSYKTGELESTVCLFNGPEMRKQAKPLPPIESYEFSNDETKVLLSAEFEPLYRHSGVSSYYLYDIAAGTFTCLTREGKQRLTTLSPDGTKVAFVRDNNLFYIDLATLDEHQITFDGKVNSIIYGTTDWVYEEEFGITQGFYWSPDSKKIAFYRFDESNVKEYTMQMWGDLYPENYKFKYPKAGEDNSRVDILIYNLESQKTLTLNTGSERDQYLPRMQWTRDANTLAYMWMSRLQNEMELFLADATSGAIRSIYREQDDAYIEVPDTWYFLEDGKHFLITSERDGYNHIYRGSFDGKPLFQVTHGNFEVVAVKGIDEQNYKIYYTARATSPINTDLCETRYNSKAVNMRILGDRRGNYNATFSNGCKYYIQIFSDANSAPVYTLHSLDAKKAKTSTLHSQFALSKSQFTTVQYPLVRTLQDNAALQAKMSEYGTGRKTFSQFRTSHGDTLNYYIILPADFDSSRAYPLLIYVYGGPGNQQVNNSYGYSDYYWYHLLAQKGYAVVCFDGRGTGGRGAAFKKQTYRDLGRMECEDAIEAARYFGSKTWIDASRIGIWGWSFGGYLSTLSLLKGNDVFKTAIAVAPVITWRYYDNIYTERFLQRPQDNPEGYDQNSPLNFADQLKGNYLLVHGTGDDNVHFQNAVDMLSALERAGKQFEFRAYPNKNHNISGGNTRLNLYQLMTDFLMRKL